MIEFLKKKELSVCTVLIMFIFITVLGCKTPTVVDNLTYTNDVEYALIIEGYEWGPSVTKIVISFEDRVSSDTINADTFTVNAGDTPRSIRNAYISDEQGVKIDNQTSKWITIEMTTGYDNTQGLSGPIENSGAFKLDDITRMNVWRDLDIYSVNLADNQSIIIKNKSYTTFTVNPHDLIGLITPETEGLNRGAYTYDDKTLGFAAYESNALSSDNSKNPLIIWLHGGGEGGTDIDIALLGNQVTNLWTDQIQNHFKSDDSNGAYVLALQAPTMWMDSGEGMQTGDNSMYKDVLINAIKGYVQNNPDVDVNRIYLGGCSNGGYMVMNLLFHEPDYFAAAFPIAQAYSNEEISDDMINAIKHIPIWFIHSQDDFVVKAKDFVIPTYVRLIQAGAQNVHFTYYNQVIGHDAPHVKYNGHLSWIYPFQDRTALDQNRNDVLIRGEEAIYSPSNMPVIIENETVTLWQWLTSFRN